MRILSPTAISISKGMNVTNELATLNNQQVAKLTNERAAILEKVAILGDLSSLSAPERMSHYLSMCEMSGTSAQNRPFEYLDLDGKLVLYATRRCTDEIRLKRHVNIEIVDRNDDGEVYAVTARAWLNDGRSDTATGAVPIVVQEIKEWKTTNNGKRYPVKGENWVKVNPVERANAIMKAETKAKRRVTLSLVGLGMIDESEIETIRNARRVHVDADGVIVTEIQPTAISENVEEPAPAPTKDDPLAAARLKLWNRVGDRGYGWTKDQLAGVSGAFYKDKELSDLSLDQYESLYQSLTAMNPEVRVKVSEGTPVTPEELGITATQETLG